MTLLMIIWLAIGLFFALVIYTFYKTSKNIKELLSQDINHPFVFTPELFACFVVLGPITPFLPLIIKVKK